MKILIDHHCPFIYAHGGFQIQIEQTQAALNEIGIEAEFLRWWDDKQTGDIVHGFGRSHPRHIRYAHGKGMKYAMSLILSSQGARSKLRLRASSLTRKLVTAMAPSVLPDTLYWSSYKLADASIVLTPWEAEVLSMLFGPPAESIHVLGNGVEQEFFVADRRPEPPGDYLVCTATIIPLKRINELALAAVRAQTPLRIVGKPFAESDPYYKRFLEINREHPQLVRYSGPVYDRSELAEIYRGARGFVLLSDYEGLSLSALEATAAGCPLLLSDRRWATLTFADHAQFCPVTDSVDTTAQHLRKFYDSCETRALPPVPPTWRNIAQQLGKIYEQILN
ncbi:MAG: hypothetical protein ACI8XO_002109 [Verrucomicrobiales bacterium]|jgi:hypothetical protein